MNCYYDTSALCRNYHPEPGSYRVAALLQDSSARHYISRVTVVEMHSAFAQKVRLGEITNADFEFLRRRFRSDMNHRRLLVVRLLRRHFDRAEKLIRRYSPRERLRTMDAIHLAIALELRTEGIIDTFVCADKALVRAAVSESMTTIDPDSP